MRDKDKVPVRPAIATALVSTEANQQRVIAHAQGAEVDLMLQVARTHEIPVVQDFALSSALRKMPAGALIPDTVFQAVAVVLDFLLRHEPLLDEQQNPRGYDEHESEQ